jgi:XTP/dITP diphosphohydrolase
MKIVFASSNQGKIKELQTLLHGIPDIDLVTQGSLNIEDVPETGLTFVENALLKARNACSVTNLPAIADDSGLAVNALNGAPGIYSARYAGPGASPEEFNNKLLHEMKNVPRASRQAAYHCVLVYLSHAADPIPLICHGIWQGSILEAPTGTGGFGYDPIFYVPTEKCSAAELPQDLKNQLSHRGQALRLLLQKLPQKLAGQTGN